MIEKDLEISSQDLRKVAIRTIKRIEKEDIPEKIKQEIEGRINEAVLKGSTKEDASAPDVFLYNMAVICLGFIVLLCASAYLIIALYGANIPESIITIGTTAVGALAGVLIPTSKKQQEKI